MDERAILLELRVLTGLQAGARLTLSDGRHVLGSGESCEVVLAGPGIEPQALVIVVDGVQLLLQPGQPGCGLSAGDSLGEPFMLLPGVPFHLGDIWLVVDHQASPWPENRSWLVSAPRPLEALSIDAADTVKAAQGVVASEPVRPASEPRRLLWWLKWTVWCIAVFCLGGLGILAWFKFGMEYLPNMRSMTAVDLSRFTEAPVGTGTGVPQVRPAEPAPVSKRESSSPPQKPSSSGVVLLGPAPTAAPLAESPMLGLPLAGSHLVQGRTRDRPERPDAGPASAADLARLPFVVRQVVCGEVASITTDKGVKLFEGASHKGYEITRVSQERLRLRGRHDVELSC